MSLHPNLAMRSWLGAPLFRWSVGLISLVLGSIVVLEMLRVSVWDQIGLPHEYCYLRQPRLIWLHVVTDALIGAAYVMISATLAYLVYRASKGIPFHWVFIAFGLFIVSCGLTHFMEVWVIWQPMYWLSGYVKVVTAAASVGTAIALVPLVPKIFSLITAARKAEERRVEIEQLNVELERFNYSVAHDLRSPLRGIVGYSHILSEDYGDALPVEARGHLAKIGASAVRMDALINDLLRYASISQKQLELRPIPLEEPLKNALALLESQLRESQADVTIASTLPTVLGDASLLQVIFQNLVANSAKFVPPGAAPKIRISAESRGREALVIMSDNGIGIAPPARDKLFRMFERANKDYPGTGIGLAMVQRAVERMRGKIGISDTQPAQGAEFWIRLPLA